MQLTQHQPNASDEPWPESLRTHPIFTVSDELTSAKTAEPQRKARVFFRGDDILVAVRNQVRIASLIDARTPRASRTYKTIHAPNVQFDIEQMSLNADGRLLAVAGTHQVSVVVLPSKVSYRTLSPTIESRSVQIGTEYHNAKNAARVVKMEWHPLGENNACLLILTADGIMREYDPTQDADEPLQTLSFVRKSRKSTFMAEDPDSQEAVSFTIGRGTADWSPLTLFGLMRSGEIFAICPFCPSNASISQDYIRSLEGYVSAKEALASEFESEDSTLNLRAVYEYQRKYIDALVQQLPEESDDTNKRVTIRAPTMIRLEVERQGPFQCEPAGSPSELEDWDDLAAEIHYMLSSTTKKDDSVPPVGIILVAFVDGRVDICLDMIKVEPLWKRQSDGNHRPLLVVLETINLGIVPQLEEASIPVGVVLENWPILIPDSLYPDTVHVYHAFGIHSLHFASWMHRVSAAVLGQVTDLEQVIKDLFQEPGLTSFECLLDTINPNTKTYVPLVGLAVSPEAFIDYSAVAITDGYRVVPIEMKIRLKSDGPEETNSSITDVYQKVRVGTTEELWPSLLSNQPFNPPVLPPAEPLPPVPSLIFGENEATPDELRQIAVVSNALSKRHNEIQALRDFCQVRSGLVRQEFGRQLDGLPNMMIAVNKRLEYSQQVLAKRVDRDLKAQEEILRRINRMLQRLMDTNAGELTAHEKAWFKELGRMKKEVISSSDGSSLKSRTEEISRQMELLIPLVKNLSEREMMLREQQNAVLGTKQMLAVGQKLGAEDLLIKEHVHKAKELAMKMNVPISNVPE